MKTYTLSITEYEAEVLGFALTKARQNFQRRYDANPKSYRASELQWKAGLAEGLRVQLNTTTNGLIDHLA